MVRPYLSLLASVACSALVICGCGAERGPASGKAGATPVESQRALQAEIDAPRYAEAIDTIAADPTSAPAVEGTTTVQAPTFREPAAASAAPMPGVPAAGAESAFAFDESVVQGRGPGLGGDKYALIEENEFLTVADSPLSTFSIDVDTASYSKTRAYLLEHHALPPPDAVRIEELINYFDYAYEGPTDEHPFAVHMETAECPWQPKHRLVRCGVQGKRIDEQRPVSNLVFLIDVSGSMDAPNRLPLVQRSLAMLVRQLGENDRVGIVVYAGAAGMVLPPTTGIDQPAILAAIENLRAGGSTNGGQGIQLAYAMAQENLVKGGVNRVILCTDGDFNVGVTSTGDLVRLAEKESKAGVYLSVLSFGFGNHNDDMLEQLSNKANGNYSFIDSDREAQKVLVEQMQGTLVTIAKDVKIQVEFNPAQIAAYRLIGYENRKLADRDFNDDTKDAGDIGAGHSVTALYEVVPVGVESGGATGVDPLKYQGTGDRGQESAEGRAGGISLPLASPDEGLSATNTAGERKNIADELLTLKLRYQPPTGRKSTLLTFPVQDNGGRFGAASADFQFAASVASFGMLLRDSQFKGDSNFAAVLETASSSRGDDKHGLKGEFLELVKAAQRLKGEKVGFTTPPAWNVSGARRAIASNSPGTPQVVAWQPANNSPPPSAPLVGWRPAQLLTMGVFAGVVVAIIGTLMMAGFVSLVTGQVVSYAPQPVWKK